MGRIVFLIVCELKVSFCARAIPVLTSLSLISGLF